MVYGKIHSRFGDLGKPDRISSGTCADKRTERDQSVPDGPLHPQPDRRDRSGVYLAVDPQRCADEMGRGYHLCRKIRFLGPCHRHELAVDRLYDGCLYCRTAEDPHRSQRSGRHRRMRAPADPLQGRHSPARSGDCLHCNVRIHPRVQRIHVPAPHCKGYDHAPPFGGPRLLH